MKTRHVTEIFHGLQKELKTLVKKIGEKKQIDDSFLWPKLKDETQWKIARHFMDILPMEKEFTRLDLSAHPFSTALHPHDSRITTRFLPEGFMSNIFSVLHESGHSMYEMGLPVDTWGTPLSESVSLSVHESQSRWWETLIGRSLPFWKGQYPFLKKHLPGLKHVSVEKFYHAINKVEPSLTRVEADEVTYCLHVILRFELEQALITGELSVSELPEAWNAKTQELLGIKVPNDAKGCLQDVHWSMGSFGYFPTYAIGNLLAAQFFTTFAKKHPDWEKKTAKGDYAFIRAFLQKNIHCHGRTYGADQLAKKISGKPLSESAYCAYLKHKYGQIYHL
jgi:carboxypeptidase Taq